MKDLNHLFGRIPIRTKLLILTLGIGTIPLVSFFVLTFLMGFYELKTLALQNLETEALAMREQALAYFQSHQQDVVSLARSPEVSALVRAQGAPGEDKARAASEAHLKWIAENNPAYFQLRYIDAEGNERVRVDRRDGVTVVTSPDKLQNKRHRYYFRDSIGLAPGQVYVSPMDYNVEHGRVEMPKLPVFRYATPIHLDGTLRGIFIINVFGRSVIDTLNASRALSFERLDLLDQKGRVIVTGHEEAGRLVLSLNLERTAADPPVPLSPNAELGADWFLIPWGEFFVELPILTAADQPDSQWWLILKGDRSRFLEPIRNFALFSLAVLAVCGLAAVLVGLLAARHFYGSLLRLKAGARKVAEGNYPVDIALNTNDELEDLAKDFTMMAGALESREKELQLHQRELETLVRQRTAQIALEKEKLERVVEGVGAGLVLFDRGTRMVWFNEFFARTIGPDTLNLGDTCCDVMSGRCRLCSGHGPETENCSIRKVFTGEPVELPLVEISGQDGERRTFLDKVAPIRDEEGRVVYALHILFDVTDKQRMEEREQAMQQQLARAEKLATLGRFTSGIAHEIGNPLGIISANAQAIQENLPEGSIPWRQLELIVSEIHRLSRITRDLNTFGKPSEPDRMPHDPRDIISGLRRLIGTQAKAHQVRVKTRIDPCGGTIHVDSQQVQQVLLNLVVNAFEAMPDGGILTLTATPRSNGSDPPHLAYTVSDTGVGIPEENLETIFDPFFTTKPGGTGFGLSLAHTMITRNGGQITVASTPGHGSTFTIVFPLLSELPAGSGADSHPLPRSAGESSAPDGERAES